MEAIKTPRTLEITVISGESLCVDRTPVTEDVYTTVRAESFKCWSTKTAKQEVGSLSALWNEKLIVEVPLHAQSITFEVQCKTPKGLVRSIGLARIAIGDVIPKEDKCLEKMLSYRLRNWEGRRSGIINFSVRVANKEQEKTEKDTDSIMGNNSADLKTEIIGVHHHQDMNAHNHNNGYVMGIPVWWSQAGVRV